VRVLIFKTTLFCILPHSTESDGKGYPVR